MKVGTNNNLVKGSSYHNKYSKIFFRSCLVIGIICIIFYTYIHLDQPKSTSQSYNEVNIRQLIQNMVNLRLGSKTPTTPKRERLHILLWTPYFGKYDWLPSTKELMCPVEECDVTSNRIRFNESSAVVLHWRDISPDDLPTCSSSNVTTSSMCPLLVLFNQEAPPHTPQETIRSIKDRVHWTVTYRRDSDILSSYGKIVPRNKPVKSIDIKTNRSHVCWLVSNCHTPSNRETYVAELQRHIDVKIYGKCGNNTCPFGKTLLCYKWLAEQCKFYLSFENSICKDYSTEKLYFAMLSDMIPVVLGGDDYTKYLPEHSFISVKEFSNPKYLAEYLLELSNDDMKYLSYFNWKKNYTVQDVSYMWLCDLCDKLHRTNLSDVKPISDLIGWWFGEAHCFAL